MADTQTPNLYTCSLDEDDFDRLIAQRRREAGLPAETLAPGEVEA